MFRAIYPMIRISQITNGNNKSSFESIILLTESSTGFIHKIKITEYFYSTKVLSV